MNQVLKDTIYSMGTQRQVNYMAMLGGMNDEERRMFQLIHEGRTDLYIQTELNLTRETYKKIEDSVRKKLLVAVFSCIDYRIDREESRT